VAAGLHEDGVRKGDVVCLFAPNVLEYPIAIYAIATLGTYAPPTHTPLRRRWTEFVSCTLTL
jgi:acyl-CoA synthetase (AMP-forming)/AMP-acid ligase II